MKFRKIVPIVLLSGLFFNLLGVEPENEKPKKEADIQLNIIIPNTPVKDQYRTSTCWSFSTISFIESELLRISGKTYDLSEMFIVRKAYEEKAKRYIRMHGNINFAGGGEPNDVINILNTYGLMPESAYSGLIDESTDHVHTDMDRVLKEFIKSLVEDERSLINKNWLKPFNAIMDSYMGELPLTFEYNNKEYSSNEFSEELGLNASDYVMISSFTHHPYYSKFILEVPDNWSWGEVYNVPLSEFTEILDSALSKGYTATWSADISEKGFNSDEGMAVAPKILYEPASEGEKRQVVKMSLKEKNNKFFDLENPVEEINVTAKKRQESFDNYSTEDDHGMHIVGKAKDKSGKEYYYVKNSWGTDNKYDGYLYVSVPYYQFKSVTIMLHKDAVPLDIRQKLNL
ncbi:MAG: aminopeptidase [Bacteroidales bacterium]|nr:aminopeptidase [Bacteroidales bacterium]MBN2820034.1 aminopeptidase [Bacteroidales bacterium]